MTANKVLRWFAGFFLVFSLVGAGVATASAQAGQRGTVEITVVDQDGNGVSGAAFNFLKFDIYDNDRTEEPDDTTDDAVVDVVDDATDDATDDVTDDDGIVDSDLLDDTADLTTDASDDATDDGTDLIPEDLGDLTIDDTDSPDLLDQTGDLTAPDAVDGIDDLPPGDDLADITSGESRTGGSTVTGDVTTLAFAQSGSVLDYLLEPGYYKVTQVLTGAGCDYVDPFRVNVDADETTEVTVVLNCDGSGDDGDDSDDGDDGDGDGDGTTVTTLPSTGNGADGGMMDTQMLFIVLSVISALVLAGAFGWNVRHGRK
jgi:hypothetical protein